MGCRWLWLMSGGVGCSYIYNKVLGGCGSRWGGSDALGVLLLMSGALGGSHDVGALLMTSGRVSVAVGCSSRLVGCSYGVGLRCWGLLTMSGRLSVAVGCVRGLSGSRWLVWIVGRLLVAVSVVGGVSKSRCISPRAQARGRLCNRLRSVAVDFRLSITSHS